MRYKVIRFYYDETIYPQYAVMDTERNDTIRGTVGHTDIMTKADAKWLCKELDLANKNKKEGLNKFEVRRSTPAQRKRMEQTDAMFRSNE